MSIKSTARFFLYTILIAMATSPAFALGEGNRNVLLIGLMGASPLLVLAFKRFHKTDVWLGVFMLSLIAAPMLNQPQSMRWSTVLYSCLFCFTFMAYTRLLYFSRFTIHQYHKLLTYLIYVYFAVLFIQQFCVLTGLPIFNLSNYNPSEPWKLNSLAAEPSHSARIVAVLMYCYIIVKELMLNRSYSLRKDFKGDEWVWLAFLWTMLTMGSGTAFLFIPIVLLKFIQKKNIIPLILLLAVMLFITNSLGITAIDRTFNVFMATLTLNPEAIIVADHSASFRIVPFIVLASMLSLTTLNGWLGHGIDYVSTFLYQYMPGAGENVTGGGLMAMAIEYGFLCFLIFIIGSIQAAVPRKNWGVAVVFWFMLVFSYGINSQILWLCIVLLFTNNHFSKVSVAYKVQLTKKEL